VSSDGLSSERNPRIPDADSLEHLGDNQRPAVLLVDDDENFWSDIRLLIGDLYQILTVPDIEAAHDFIQSKIVEVVLLDLDFHGRNEGYEFLEYLQAHYPEIPVIMVSLHEKPQFVVKAMQLGAVGYLGKTPSRGELDLNLRTALELRSSRIRIRALNEEAASEDAIVGNSSAIGRLRQDIRRFAGFDRPVLISGEPGTGKNLCAQAIHSFSARSDEPFVTVNCAAFTPTLLESEIFGHERGAFEDAQRRRVGRLQEAGQGTIYLDGVAAMSAETQHKLSRVITERSFRPLGSQQIVPLRARIIAGSCMDLVREVRERRFLQALLLQLNVLPLRLPPLRERVEDIEPLAQHLIYRISLEMKRTVPTLARDALRILQRQNWRGNVRELRGVIENALVHNSGSSLEPGDFKLIDGDAFEGLSYEEAKSKAMEQFQRSYTLPILRATQGSVTRACEIMGLPRQTLYRIMRKLNLNKEQFRGKGKLSRAARDADG